MAVRKTAVGGVEDEAAPPTVSKAKEQKTEQKTCVAVMQAKFDPSHQHVCVLVVGAHDASMHFCKPCGRHWGKAPKRPVVGEEETE